MRFIAIGMLLLTLPLLVAYLRAREKNRDIVITLFGLLAFFGGTLSPNFGIVVWEWPGTTQGMGLAPTDMLALALLITQKRTGKALPFTLLLASYLAILVLSVTYSFVRVASLFSVWDFCRVFVAFLAVGGEIGRPSAYRALLRGFALGLMLQAGFVIDQKLSGVVQASGTMSHQNLLGMMTYIVFLNMIAAMLEGERDRLVMLGAVAGAVIIAGGGSRAAMGLVGSVTLLLIAISLVRSRTSGKVAIAAGAGVLLVLTAPIAFFTLKERFGDASLITDESVREALEDAARSMSRDHPLGVGTNLFAHVNNVEGYASRSGVSWYGANRAMPVHNGYLLARAETGYHGEAVFALLLLIPMIAGFRHAFRYRHERSEGWVLGSAMAMAAVAIHSFVEFNALVYSAQLPLAMNIGIIAGRIRTMQLARHSEDADQVPAQVPGDALDPGIPPMPRIPSRKSISIPAGLPGRPRMTPNKGEARS